MEDLNADELTLLTSVIDEDEPYNSHQSVSHDPAKERALAENQGICMPGIPSRSSGVPWDMSEAFGGLSSAWTTRLPQPVFHERYSCHSCCRSRDLTPHRPGHFCDFAWHHIPLRTLVTICSVTLQTPSKHKHLAHLVAAGR